METDTETETGIGIGKGDEIERDGKIKKTGERTRKKVRGKSFYF